MNRGLVLAVVVVVAAAAGWWLAPAPGEHAAPTAQAPDPAPALEIEAPLEPGGMAGLAAASQSPEPGKAVPPIFGHPEPPAGGVEFCDEQNWSRIDRLVDRVVGADVYVRGERWSKLSARTRVGIASWAMRCRNVGRAVELREAGSERLLAAFGPIRGYSEAEQQQP